jgi:hypothetical protein
VAVQIRLAAIVLIAGLLAACTSGDAQPTPSTSSIGSVSTDQTSPSPSQTGPLTTGPNVRPGEKPPEFPALARHAVTGAILFARYYVLALDWSIATTDSYLVRAISLPSCKACARVVAFIARLRRDHEVLHGGRLVPERAEEAQGVFNFKADVVVRIRAVESAETRAGPSGTPTPVAGRSTTTSLIFLDWTAAGWRVAEVAAP